MKAFALAATALLILTAPVQQARANVDVSIDFFYDAMQPYGDWIYINGYGYCWQPGIDVVGANWQPYTDGYWAYTDAGWTWISNEPFGWATYHYGRWMINAGSWCWVPGYEWAPAWVSWRQTSNHIGWAPLPPEAYWSAGVGFNNWTDSYYGIGPDYYSFVPLSSFACRTSLLPYVVSRYHNVAFMSLSVNITNIRYQNNVVNHIFVGGPDVNRIDRIGGGHVPRYTLRHDDDAMRRDWLGSGGTRNPRSLSRIDRDQLIVASPGIRRDERPGIPTHVRESYGKPDIDHGWRSAGNSEQGRYLRSQHEQEARHLPPNLPERRPVIATSSTPPPAVGRTFSSAERHGSAAGSGGSAVRTEEIRRATPMETVGRPSSTRPETTSFDSRARFNGTGLTPAPGSQRSGTSPLGSRTEVPQVSQPSNSPPQTRPVMPSPSVAPQSRPSFTPRPSTPSVTPPTSSRPSIPQSRPSFTPRPSTPSVTPPTSSRPSIPQSRPSFTPRPSTPSVTPPSSSRPSIPQLRPSFTPRPSTPSVTPPSSSRPTMPQPRPSFTPRPSTPSVTPPSSSRPSIPQSRPSFTPRPSTSSVTPPSSSRPSIPQSRPSFTPRPGTPSVATPSNSRPSGGASGGADPRGPHREFGRR